MGEERIRLYRAVPGPTSIGPLLASFSRDGEGSITSLSDAMLPALRDSLGDDTDCEVASFGSLVRRALEAAGEEALFLATTSQQAAALAQAAALLETDSPFKNAPRFTGLRDALVNTLGDLHEWGISGNELRELADHAVEPLARKLADLSFLSDGSERLLRAIGRDTHARQLQQCRQGIADSDERNRRLLIFLGSEAAPAKLDWLLWAATQGYVITAVVDRHAAESSFFQRVKLIERYLGVSAVEIGSGNRLLNNLFSSEQKGGTSLPVRIASAADPLAECEWALRACLDKSLESRCTIYVRNLERYAPLLESSAARLHARLHVPRRVALLQNAFVRMTLSVLQACAGNDVRLFRHVLTSSYLGLNASQRTSLQAAITDAHNHRDRQWSVLEEWLVGPDPSFEWLQKVLSWRKEVLANSCSLTGWCQRLRDLVHELPWHLRLASSPGYDALRDERAFNVMQAALAGEAAIEAVAGKAEMGLAGFLARCRAIWDAADVSVPAQDGILVVSDAASASAADHVFVLGMLEGVFPRRRSEEPILTDSERQWVSDHVKVPIPLPTSYDEAAGEREEFYRVCALAGGSLTFSYPLADDQRDNIPAFYLEFVKQAVPDDVVQEDHPRSELAPVASTTWSIADIEMRSALDGPRDGPQSITISSPFVRALLRKDCDSAMSPEQLRDALQCPFRYQVRDHLDLAGQSQRTHWSKLRKLPQIARLSETASIEDAEQALNAALEVELDRLFSQIPDWEMQILRAGGRRLIREWSHKEALARQIWAKDPGSSLQDVRLGSHGLRDVMPGGIKISDILPAISTMDGSTLVLHLYSYSAKVDRELSEADRLYYGLYFLAGHGAADETAIEIEGMDGKRTMLVLTRNGIRPLASKVGDGLQVIDLSTSDDGVNSKNKFYKELRQLLDRATHRIENGEITPLNGDHCEWCECGELCRRSKMFSDDDSPFGQDMAIDEA